MKATFSSPRQIDFKPIDNNETILLEHMKDIANNQLSFTKDEKYGDISLVINEPKNIAEVDNLAGKIIHMNFPESFRDLVDTHEIMLMKDGSKIECLVLTQEAPEEVVIPELKFTDTGVTDEAGLHEYKCTCGYTVMSADETSISHTEEEHKQYYLEHKDDKVEEPSEDNKTEGTGTEENGCPTLTENNDKYQSVVPEGYYVDPTAPCGFRKCRPGHIHGATYMHPDCCICNDHLESLMKRTIVIRLISETLGEVVLFSLVGIDDVRINMKLFKVDTTTDMTVLDVNKNSPFYDCFKI